MSSRSSRIRSRIASKVVRPKKVFQRSIDHGLSSYAQVPTAFACICLVLFLAGRPLAAAEKLLFDFKDGAALKAWSQFLPDNLKVPGAKEPPVKIELSGENAASGKRCLKLTFSGGKYPAVATHSPLEDWTVYNSFKADVTASRTCLVAFRVVREDDKEHRGWVKLALAPPRPQCGSGRRTDAKRTGQRTAAERTHAV